jgi:thiamine monophosphate synthase
MHKYLPNFFIFLDHYNNEVFKKKNKNIGIIYRNYKDKNRENQLIKIAEGCKKCSYKLFVSNDIKLVHKFKADGIYIPSFNKAKRKFNLEKKKILIIGSAHNQKEIYEKKLQKCSAIFISPIFSIEKSKTFLGLHRFNYLTRINNIRAYGLGGISENNINKLRLFNISGFGGIRIFKKKPASKRPVFIKNKFF